MKAGPFLHRWLPLVSVLCLEWIFLGEVSCVSAGPLAKDPVDALAQLLRPEVLQPFIRGGRINPEELQLFKARLHAAGKKLQTTGDLARALLLEQLDGQEPLKELHTTLLDRLTTNLRAALTGEDSLLQAAAASQVAELAAACQKRFAQRADVPVLKSLKSLVPDLVKQLQQKDPLVRLTSARALGEIASDAPTWEALGDRLEADEDSSVAAAAAGALRKLLAARLTLLPGPPFLPGPILPGQPGMPPESPPSLDQSSGLIAMHGKGLKRNIAAVRCASLQNFQLAAKLLLAHVPPVLNGEENPNPPPDKGSIDVATRQLQSLCLCCQAMQKSIAAITPGLGDKDPTVRLATLEALESIGALWHRVRRAEGALAAIKASQGAPDPDEKKEPQRAKPDKPAFAQLSLKEVLPGVRDNLKHEDLRIRLAAFYLLETLRSESTPALKEVVAALGDKNLFIRWAAARTLEQLAPHGASLAVPALAAVVKDEDADVRISALLALKRYGPQAEAAVGRVGEVLKTSDLDTRKQAIEVLLAIGTAARAAAPALIEALTAPEAEVRSAAAQALGQLCSDDKEARNGLRKALLDSNADVRRLASIALLSQPKKE